MKNSRFWTPRAIVLIPLLLALSFIIACGGGATSTPVGDAAPTPTLFVTVVAAGTPVSKPTVTTAPAMQVKTGGIIPMQSYTAPITARPLMEATVSGTIVLGPLYNQLVEYNPETDETEDIRCDLCTSWDMSADGKTYTYKLNQNARWSDGTPVTSTDVVFTLNSINDPSQFGTLWEGHTGRARSGMWKPYFESTRAIDTYTVEVKLGFPAAAWHAALALEPVKIGPEHIMVGKQIMQGYHAPEEMVTSGPFRHVSFTKDVSFEQTRNEDYFKEGRPYINGITHFVIRDEGSVIAAFAAEEVLMTDSNIDNIGSIGSKQFLDDYGDRYNVHFVGPASRFNVMMNTEKAPFDDPLVRRAIMLGIHRQEIIDIFSVGDFQLGLPFPPGTWYGRTLQEAEQVPGFRLLNGQKHPDDIAAAKALLTQAGYPNGFDSEILLTQGSEQADIGIVIVEQLKKFLNVDLDIVTMERAARQAAITAGDYSVGVQANALAFLDPDSAFIEYKKGGLAERWARAGNTLNWDKLNNIFDQQTRELDPVKRKALIREAEDSLLNEDIALVGTHYITMTFNVHKKIHGIHPHPSVYASGQKWEHIWCDPAC